MVQILFANFGYGIFGIMQCGDYQDLRAMSAEKLKAIGFDGYAIGKAENWKRSVKYVNKKRKNLMEINL